ncbi:MAG: ferredoxin [Firmicutes bacterium GWF2_51_9]|nr:MAG: ferredoxin [Firmicutes bacterium GWF2_51_9]OGS57832.1 MAG: ferredoxin [Firmicutes bacterium GWE2_51_13]HAM63216.1 ferredoxin [Erysipelotrichaceae bacterium]HAO61300.1 ferredoxin [Erysipelotrichaceae bacterium]HBZ41388.1 ferredoxin [Erysipelotrichaceae bacterium]
MKKRKSKVRTYIQILFFALIAILAVNNTLAESDAAIAWIPVLSLHAICPFGGVVTLYNLATVGDYIQKIHASSVILLAISIVMAILFGPVLCGWICPLGSLQEWIGKIGKRIFKKKYNAFVPKKADRYLRYIRYLVLIWVVYVTAKSGTLVFKNVDPYNALFTFWSEEVSYSAVLVLILTLVGSLFIERPWCKYACPYGALMGISNKFRMFKIRRNEPTCIHCTKCDRACPMNIEVSKGQAVKNAQCISCYECTSEQACPIPDTVTLSATFKKVVAGDKV